MPTLPSLGECNPLIAQAVVSIFSKDCCMLGTRDVISCNPLVPETRLIKIQVNSRTR